MTFKIWRYWLLTASVFLVGFGLFLILFPNSTLLAPWHTAIAAHFFDGITPQEVSRFRNFLLGPLGGTIAGFYTLQTFVLWKPFDRREPWAWQATTAALLVWFVLDSATSLFYGAAFNIWLVNLAPMFVFAVPLAQTYPYFFLGKEDVGA